MNADHDSQLEAQIDRELKSLPPLAAPATLAPRVMAAIASRAAALVVLAAFFASLCLGAWRLPDTEGYLAAARHAAGWTSSLTTLWNGFNAVLGALAQAVQQLGRGFLIGCLAAVALAWAICLGLGTACLRLTFARR